jgi:molybdenum cofactor cytidylyltransferase
MIFALIPAAGLSSRMGRPKLTLPLGDGTVLGHVLEALRRARIEHILVVVGPRVPELVTLARAAGVAVLSLPDETVDMRSTIEHGLGWLEAQFHPGHNDNWLLMPADHPALSAGVVLGLVRAREGNPAYSIVVPTFQGRRGHPVLLGWEHVEAIRKLPAGQGLNIYLRKHAGVTLEVTVDSADILDDLDTPEDYERLRHAWPHRSMPPIT